MSHEKPDENSPSDSGREMLMAVVGRDPNVGPAFPRENDSLAMSLDVTVLSSWCFCCSEGFRKCIIELSSPGNI